MHSLSVGRVDYKGLWQRLRERLEADSLLFTINLFGQIFLSKLIYLDKIFLSKLIYLDKILLSIQVAKSFIIPLLMDRPLVWMTTMYLFNNDQRYNWHHNQLIEAQIIAPMLPILLSRY